MKTSRLRFSIREAALLLIAMGALAFAWLGTAQADDSGTVGTSSEVESSTATDDDFFGDEDKWMDEDEWLEAEDMTFETAAKLIGIGVEALFAELDSGKSIADVATANGVDPQTVIDTLIAEEAAFIDQMLADGEITQAEADEWKADSATYTTHMVTSVYIDPFVIAATTIGIDAATLETEVFENGKSLKELAEANNVDPQAVIDAIVASEDAAIDGMLADGVITEAEATEWKAENVAFATEMVNEAFGGFDDEMFFGDEDGWMSEDEWMDEDEWLEAEDMTFETAANVIGIDVEALFTELDSGKSIADVANANGVDPQTVIDALVAEEATLIDQMLADGEISQEEADEWKADSIKYTAYTVNTVCVDPYAVAATAIGIDAAALETELFENGKSIKDVAEANNVDPQTVIDAIVASEDASIDEMLAAGLITEAESAEWKAENVAFATEIVNESFDFDFDFDEDKDETELESDKSETDK